ncbi:sensor histidine kinase [Catenovulum sp. SX2]|uniref:sensor histidine kinase n=1 Tax=Catenovulum sp. SX2 TaxID=3398614 RepID=UPI003F87F850
MKNRFYRFLTAGIDSKHDIALTRRLVLISSLLTMIMVLFSFFSLYNLFQQKWLLSVMDVAGFAVSAYAMKKLQLDKNYRFAIRLVTLALSVFLISFSAVNQNQSYGLVWTFFYPLFVFMLEGRKRGVQFVLPFYLILISLAGLGIGEWQNGEWDLTSFIRFSIASIVMAYVCYFSEMAIENSHAKLEEAKEEQTRLHNQRTQLMATSVAQKSQVLADISHDLRTPLSILKMNFELIEDEIYTDKQKVFTNVWKTFTDFEQLISQVSAAARSDEQFFCNQRSPTNLVEMIASITEAQTRAVKYKSMQLYFVVKDKNIVVDVDPDNLRQALSNLIDNSVKHTHAGGEIHIAVLKFSDKITIEIADSAPGIPTEDFTLVFEPLYRADDSRNRATGGAGLGLYISKKIIEAHGGKISAANSTYGGLKLTIDLPLLQKN